MRYSKKKLIYVEVRMNEKKKKIINNNEKFKK